MRVFVFGVLLAHTLNAQVSDGTVTALDEPAPLITPGSDAPAEADLLGTSPDAAIDDGGVAAAGFDATATGDDLPTGTADVIVDTTPTDATAEEATTTDDSFGAGETEGPGVEVGGSEFDFPTASDADDAPEETTTTDGSLPEETNSAGISDDLDGTNETTAMDVPEQATATEEFGLGSEPTATSETTPIDDFSADSPEATPVDDSTDGTETDELLDDIPTESPIAEPESDTDPTGLGEGVDDLAAATPAPDAGAIELGESDDQTDPLAEQTEPVIFPDPSATPVLDDGVSGADVTEEPSLEVPTGEETAAAPEATGPAGLEEPATVEEPAPVEEPIEPAAAESSSTIDLGPTPFLDPLAAPEVTPSLGGALAGGVGAAYAGGADAGTWTGEDAGHYEGQDVEDEDCPASCYEEDEDDSYSTTSTASTEDGEDEDDDEGDDDIEDESLVKKVVRWISRRALGSDGGFAAFSWPIDQKDKTASYEPEEEDCGEDLPGWLYESAGKKPEACPAPKDKCPAKCYEYGTGPKPYPVSSISGGYETYSTPAASSIGYGYSVMPDVSSASQEYTPYPVPDESTTGYYENTATSTQTTFVTSTTTVPGGYQDNGGQVDYTGDTLASICPKTCDPFNPAANKCDITSSCTTTGKGKYYCACRAGYRASAWNAKDFSKQFKFPDQPYVYTAEGVVCDKVCSDQTCTEVLSRPQCQ